ncbi:MAG: hypothetical protein ACKPJD_06900, partial [Planctomycetaceae bacterium]
MTDASPASCYLKDELLQYPVPDQKFMALNCFTACTRCSRIVCLLTLVVALLANGVLRAAEAQSDAATQVSASRTDKSSRYWIVSTE